MLYPYFFLLKCFFLALFFLSALSFRSFADRQPVLSSSQFSDVSRCEAALGQQETFLTCISDLENATACMRFEDSSKLSRDCHNCVDLLMDLVRISAKRGRDVLWEEKATDQVYVQTFIDLRIPCGVWIFLGWKHIHNPVLVPTS